ncbi:MAG: two-component system, response regulator YesN [Moorella sp. (in: firmicutes)]|nr:two-component system, response regulator YesN [Moorella sp. (in: firmicutes)]
MSVTAPGQIVGTAILKRLLRSFTAATGMRVTIFGKNSEPIIGIEDYAYHCHFCQLVNSVAEGAARCRETHRRACSAVNQGLLDPYIFFCHAGLVHWAAPIKRQDEILATMVCGQTVMWELDDRAVEEIFSRVADLGLPPPELRAAIKKLRVLPARQVQEAAELLKRLAARAATAGSEFRRPHQEEPFSGLALWDWLVEMAPWQQGDNYQMELESELVNRVRLGDRLGAETVLERLLGNILFNNMGRAEIIKYRLLELMALFSRAAAAGGARPEEILSLSATSMQKLMSLSLEESLLWLIEILDECIDRIYQARETRQTPPVEKAVAFINANYGRSISLEDVALVVNLSPAHLSRLFKKEMGRTVIEYLTLVRLEVAKRLLREGKTIEEVAAAVGFNEATYFSRVFKREVGVPPGIFRDQSA